MSARLKPCPSERRSRFARLQSCANLAHEWVKMKGGSEGITRELLETSPIRHARLGDRLWLISYPPGADAAATRTRFPASATFWKARSPPPSTTIPKRPSPPAKLSGQGQRPPGKPTPAPPSRRGLVIAYTVKAGEPNTAPKQNAGPN